MGKKPTTLRAGRRVEALAHRYLHDAAFHALVTRLRQLDVSDRDLRDAVRFALGLRRSEREHPMAVPPSGGGR